jgi:flagellar basal-body rod protein FlgB
VNLPDVPLFAMLKERMTWLHQRQDLLSQNVANADTPGYVARDLKALDFESALRKTSGGAAMMTTNARHIAIAPTSASKFDDVAAPDVASSPNGNAVSLEMEMIKVSDTQAQFQAAANLYAKAMTLMKTAIGH